MADIPDSWILGQFIDLVNLGIHRNNYGGQIWEDTDGVVDIVVSGIGTGGTITGVGQVLKQLKPAVKVASQSSRPSRLCFRRQFGPHKIQGPAHTLLPMVPTPRLYDEIVTV